MRPVAAPRYNRRPTAARQMDGPGMPPRGGAAEGGGERTDPVRACVRAERQGEEEEQSRGTRRWVMIAGVLQRECVL